VAVPVVMASVLLLPAGLYLYFRRKRLL